MTAPIARRVDMLSGEVAPTKYFQALSEADDFVREMDGLRELQTRVQELEAERDDWQTAAAAMKFTVAVMTADTVLGDFAIDSEADRAERGLYADWRI